jgi:uncharacterized protein (TIGR03118 family)
MKFRCFSDTRQERQFDMLWFLFWFSLMTSAQYVVQPLISDTAGAVLIDPTLRNAWGVSFSPTGPFWISSNHGSVSNVYSLNATSEIPVKSSLVVSIPGEGSVTGQVFNPNATGSFNGDLFIFVSEDGVVSGWRPALGTTAEVLFNASGVNSYKGMRDRVR